MSWFYDNIAGCCSGLEVKKRLYQKKNKFQEIQIFETKNWGRILTLDKTIQTAERDEFIYHEMISHVPLFLHPSPKNVLIIGGGDGGVLREVLKHDIKEATLVEIDSDIIEASKKYLPKIHNNSFFNKKAKIVIGDGVEFIKKNKNEYDAILVDSTDPVGPAIALFSEEFYKNALIALKPGGIMVVQSGAVFAQFKEFSGTFKKISKVFPYTAFYLTAIPTYPSAFWSFTIASKNINFAKQSFEKIENKFKLFKKQLKFYNARIHQTSFAVPEFLKSIDKDLKKRKWR